MKEWIIMAVIIALVFVIGLPIQSQATTMVDSRDAFVAGCASTADVDFSGSIIPEPEYGYSDIIELGTPIGLPGGNTLTFNVRMWVREVGLTWFTWDGEYEGDVLQPTPGTSSVTGTFSGEGVPAFGMDVAVDPSNWTMSLTLSDGSYMDQVVYTNNGAKLFGYIDGVNITSFTISPTSGTIDFAIGRMIVGTPVPVPGSLLLLGTGLLGMGALGWRCKSG